MKRLTHVVIFVSESASKWLKEEENNPEKSITEHFSLNPEKKYTSNTGNKVAG